MISSETLSLLKEKKNEISIKVQRNNFKTDTSRRLRYYVLLRDYINSPGATTAESFFKWYPRQLDLRMEKAPAISRGFFKLTNGKNEVSMRTFLDEGASRNDEGEGLVSILKDWIPDDELRVISASASSDITKALDVLIDMAQDKISNRKQITDAISANLPLIIITFILHYIIFTMLYTSFVSPGLVETLDHSKLTPIESNYLTYYWLTQPLNATLTLAVIGALIFGLSWSVKNWHKRAVVLREEFFDFLPPWSLSKINQQYQVLMVINNFFDSGSSFQDALFQARKGANPYVQRQIDKIISNSSIPANEAINILFFGEMGSIIRERGEHVPLQQAIKSLVPTLKKIKKDKFERSIKIMAMTTIKPMAYFSLAWALWPIILYFVDLLSGLQGSM